MERTWKYDNDNRKIFTSPRLLSSASNGNIFVSDILSKELDGRIVILKEDGGILNTYTGHRDIHRDGTIFMPHAITQTQIHVITF